jgi:hypothetical protein
MSSPDAIVAGAGIVGAACGFLFGWPADTVRPPLFPISVDSLKEAEA